MTLFQRTSRLLGMDLNRVIDNAEDPAETLDELILDLQGSIADLEREARFAVERQMRLEKGVELTLLRVLDLERKMPQARSDDDHDLLRRIREAGDEARKLRRLLADELREATRHTRRIKVDLVCLRDRAKVSRRKQQELRSRAADPGRRAGLHLVEDDDGVVPVRGHRNPPELEVSLAPDSLSAG